MSKRRSIRALDSNSAPVSLAESSGSLLVCLWRLARRLYSSSKSSSSCFLFVLKLSSYIPPSPPPPPPPLSGGARRPSAFAHRPRATNTTATEQLVELDMLKWPNTGRIPPAKGRPTRVPPVTAGAPPGLAARRRHMGGSADPQPASPTHLAGKMTNNGQCWSNSSRAWSPIARSAPPHTCKHRPQ